MDKPKRQLTEQQLRHLAEARQRSIVARKKISTVKKAEKIKKTKEFENQYKEAKQLVEPPVEPAEEPTPEPMYDPPAPPPSLHSSDEDEPEPPPRRSRGKKAAYSPEPKLTAKEQYYFLKTKLLEQQQRERHDELEQLLAYSRAPVSRHAYDVAANNLKAKVDKQVYASAFQSLFPYG
jgi:hypothetical protein